MTGFLFSISSDGACCKEPLKAIPSLEGYILNQYGQSPRGFYFEFENEATGDWLALAGDEAFATEVRAALPGQRNEACP